MMTTEEHTLPAGVEEAQDLPTAKQSYPAWASAFTFVCLLGSGTLAFA